MLGERAGVRVNVDNAGFGRAGVRVNVDNPALGGEGGGGVPGIPPYPRCTPGGHTIPLYMGHPASLGGPRSSCRMSSKSAGLHAELQCAVTARVALIGETPWV